MIGFGVFLVVCGALALVGGYGARCGTFSVLGAALLVVAGAMIGAHL